MPKISVESESEQTYIGELPLYFFFLMSLQRCVLSAGRQTLRILLLAKLAKDEVHLQEKPYG